MLSTMNEERVITLAQHDADAFDVREAYDHHGGALYGFALNSTRDQDIAADCVQETFVRAWRARDRYRSARGSQRTWLFAIARNVVADAIRARARRPAPVSDERIERGSPAVTEAEAIEDRIVLHHALALLSPDHREVIVAVQLDGMSYQQLAERTGIPAATLRTRMFYGMKALREALREEDQR